jgi:hypothetical protein
MGWVCTYIHVSCPASMAIVRTYIHVSACMHRDCKHIRRSDFVRQKAMLTECGVTEQLLQL